MVIPIKYGGVEVVSGNDTGTVDVPGTKLKVVVFENLPGEVTFSLLGPGFDVEESQPVTLHLGEGHSAMGSDFFRAE